VRPLLGNSFQSATLRRRGRRPQPREQGQPALHRDLEPRLHPVQRECRWHVLSARRQARRHRHGFERVAGIYATTRGFKFFGEEPSNYNADIFAKLFACVEKLSGKQYKGTVPKSREGLSEQENIDIAFRVLADHSRCVSCAIADGILPGNDGRNYVVRRILRRGILYGKKLGLATGFFEQLVAPVVESLGDVFPELKQQQDLVRRVIRGEEESFGRTLDRGLQLFEQRITKARTIKAGQQSDYETYIPGDVAFELYDTYGFPLDMTQLLANERGIKVDFGGF